MRIIRSCTFIMLLFCFSRLCFSVNLISVYQQALANDPDFQIARASYLADTQNADISRASLYPNMDITAGISWAHQDNIYPGQESTTSQYSLNLTQPLFDYGKWMNYQAAEAGVKSSRALYAYSLQDLMVRVTQAYMSVLQRKELLELSEKNSAVLRKRLQQTRIRFKAGISKTADVDNARAAYDATRAGLVRDENAYLAAQADLEAITGIHQTEFAPLKKSFPLSAPQPRRFSNWARVMQQKNLLILADRYAAAAALKTIQQQQAGHYPVLSASAAYGGNYARGSGLSDTHANSASVGLSLNIPVYQGGLVPAQIRQAQYNYQKITAQMLKDDRAAYRQLQQAYNGVLADIRAIRLDRQAVQSNERSYQSTEIAYRAGTRNMIDLLIAQQALFNAEQAYLQDKYQYFKDFVSLKQAAGSLSVNDLVLINRAL